jgi:hypothetical protein
MEITQISYIISVSYLKRFIFNSYDAAFLISDPTSILSNKVVDSSARDKLETSVELQSALHS